MSEDNPTITMEQIARQANVSRMTVSNVLSGRYKAKRPTAVDRAERIRRIAREMGYRPNAAARAVRSGRFGMIALLLATRRVHSMLPEGLLNGVYAALSESELRLEVAALPDEQFASEQRMPTVLRELAADGMLIDYTGPVPQRTLELIEAHRVPAIWLNVKRPTDCVHPDDYGAGCKATRRLLDLGHQRIGYMDFWHQQSAADSHYSTIDRCRGYEQVMVEAGLTPRMLGPITTRLPAVQWVDWARRVLQAPDRPTAILAYTPRQAAAVYCACVGLGLDVPDDVSLVTFGASPDGHLGIAISRMLLPHMQMGRVAVDMLVEKIDSPGRHMPATALPFDFQAGQSIAPAR